MTRTVFGFNIVNPDSRTAVKRDPARVAFFTFDGDLGCQHVLFEDVERLEQIRRMVDIVYWPLKAECDGVTDDGIPDYDIGIVEGQATTERDRALLEGVRESASVLIALGTCTRSAGDLPEGFFDYHVPGCPIDLAEFAMILQRALMGEGDVPTRPTMCASCHLAGNHCRLDDGEPCLGIITPAGCGAACISLGYPCVACRGISGAGNLESAKDIYERNKIPIGELTEALSLFNAGASDAGERGDHAV
jgi:coenzyme F420-reducing hydrogenase gamma subunit